jgi:hypothetical protein
MFCIRIYGQHIALTVHDAAMKGLTIDHMDSTYKSAGNKDTSKAVFKTDTLQHLMYNAYVNLLKDFGKFLKENNFYWEEKTKCWNRIYFSKDGTIDYFLYNFQEQLSLGKEKEFERLLNLFIKNYQIPMTASVKFAQCSPVSYEATSDKAK